MKNYLVRFGIPTLIVLGIFGIHTAFAQTLVSGKDILKSTQILGIGVVRSGSVKLEVVDATDLTADTQITLPTLTGNDGMIYVVKHFPSSGQSQYMYSVAPQSGENLEGIQDQTILFSPTQSMSAIFVADTDNSTWWMISKENFTSI